MRTIAIYGGSFDPPHIGHVMAVTWALSVAGVDEVWVFPVFVHKFDKNPSDFAHRLKLCAAAMKIFGDNVAVRDDERTLGEAGGDGATIDLVRHLQLELASENTQLRLLMGSDQLPSLDRWVEVDELLRLAPPLVIGRAGRSDGAADSKFAIPDVSSTAIREALRAGESVDGWVPREVAALLGTGGIGHG